MRNKAGKNPKQNESLEENLRLLLNHRFRARNALRKGLFLVENMMRGCDDEAEVKRAADEMIKMNMILKALSAEIISHDMRIDQAVIALGTSMVVLGEMS